MHPPSTRHEFLRLRVHGLSLAAIGRRLHVSKPTLIAWNRQSQAEIAARILEEKQRVNAEVASSAAAPLADLKRKYQGLKQELFSRAMRDIPTSQIEILAGEYRQQIDQLESSIGGTSSSGGTSSASPHNPIPTTSASPDANVEPATCLPAVALANVGNLQPASPAVALAKAGNFQPATAIPEP